jgi:acyl-CoA synthetase (AMP-forming)/AMP-acid ligase II
MGGAPVLPATVRRLAVLAPGVDVRAVYGLTEALPDAVASGDEVLASPAGRTSLGRPLPGVSVRIDGPDPTGVGEIVVRAAQARHRLAGEAPTEEVRTGDLGEVGADGTHLLAGRAKNMIIRGQANIYPELVEPLLLEHLHAAVRDCALVGLPDPVTGDEQVVLAVVADGSVGSGGSAASVDPAVASRVSRLVHTAWAALADEAWRPDDVVLVAAVPRRGRSGAVDLDALRDLVSHDARRTVP